MGPWMHAWGLTCNNRKQWVCPTPAKPRADATDLTQQSLACPTPATETADTDTTARHSAGKIGKKSTFTEGEHVIVYDFKSKLSSRGKIVKVLGHNTYSVDCGKGLQHVSGSALSKSSWQPRDDSSRGD